MNHPMQPVQSDDDGVARFKPNKIVRFLLDWATPRGMSLNDLAMMPFDADDRSQLAQLIGYSVSGFGELHFANPEHVKAADAAADRLIDAAGKGGE